MGRASRWLRSLFAGKKAAAPPPPPSDRRHSKEKRRWAFAKSFRGRPLPPPPEPSVKAQATVEATPAVYVEEDQNKRAIAVAAATAAVAEAAVAAAHAAAAVVRLTSSGRSAAGAKREEGAAVKIQAAFRGYLARRALRALKGLVKLQALVRGNIVRKQAAEALRCMQALVRVQARARACRAIRSERSNSGKATSPNQPGPPTPEKREPIQAAAPRPGNLKRNSSKLDGDDQNRAQTSAGWNWLDRWMEERYWDSRESARRGSGNSAMDDEKNAKILEIDPGKPHCNTKRRNNHHHHHHHHVQSSCSTVTSDHNSRSFATVPDGDSDSAAACVGMQQCLSPLRFPVVSEAGEFTDSPQFFSASSSRPGSSRRGGGGPFTPGKSDCSRSLFSGYSDYPNYMSNTESWRAKVRSQSAPKQRPELEKKASQKSALQAKFATRAYPGSGRLDRLGMPLRC